MKRLMSVVARACSAVVLTSCCFDASAADIIVAQVAPMQNPVAVEGRETNIGMKVAFAASNTRKDFAGQSIVLKTLDDGYDAAKTISLIQEVARSDAVALLQVVGSPTMAKLLEDKVLQTAAIPLIGVIPGAESFRKPLNPYVFHVRASDDDQYRKLIRNALTIGLKRIAIAYLDTETVKRGVDTMEALLLEANLKPVAKIAISPRAAPRAKDNMAALRDANPDLIVVAAPGIVTGEFIRAYRAQGLTGQITSLSYGDPDTICKRATPEVARGISVAQIFPSVRNTTLPLVKQFLDEYRQFGPADQKPNPKIFEGYVSARVLMEALRRVDGQPTRQKVLVALNSMQHANFGGFPIDFSPTKHNGSDFVEIGVVR